MSNQFSLNTNGGDDEDISNFDDIVNIGQKQDSQIIASGSYSEVFQRIIEIIKEIEIDIDDTPMEKEKQIQQKILVKLNRIINERQNYPKEKFLDYMNEKVLKKDKDLANLEEQIMVLTKANYSLKIHIADLNKLLKEHDDFNTTLKKINIQNVNLVKQSSSMNNNEKQNIFKNQQVMKENEAQHIDAHNKIIQQIKIQQEGEQNSQLLQDQNSYVEDYTEFNYNTKFANLEYGQNEFGYESLKLNMDEYQQDSPSNGSQNLQSFSPRPNSQQNVSDKALIRHTTRISEQQIEYSETGQNSGSKQQMNSMMSEDRELDNFNSLQQIGHEIDPKYDNNYLNQQQQFSANRKEKKTRISQLELSSQLNDVKSLDDDFASTRTNTKRVDTTFDHLQHIIPTQQFYYGCTKFFTKMLTRQVQMLESNIKNYYEQKSGLDLKIQQDTYEKAYENVQLEHQNFQLEQNEKIQDAQEQLKVRENECSTYLQEQFELKAQHDEKHKEVEVHKQRLSLKEQELAEHQKIIEEKEEMIGSHKVIHEEITQKLSFTEINFNQNIREVEVKAVKHKEDHQEALNTINYHQQTIKQHEEKSFQLTDDNNKLKQEKNELFVTFNSTQKLLQQYEQSHETLTQINEDLNQELAFYKDKHEEVDKKDRELQELHLNLQNQQKDQYDQGLDLCKSRISLQSLENHLGGINYSQFKELQQSLVQQIQNENKKYDKKFNDQCSQLKQEKSQIKQNITQSRMLQSQMAESKVQQENQDLNYIEEQKSKIVTFKREQLKEIENEKKRFSEFKQSQDNQAQQKVKIYQNKYESLKKKVIFAPIPILIAFIILCQSNFSNY